MKEVFVSVMNYGTDWAMVFYCDELWDQFWVGVFLVKSDFQWDQLWARVFFVESGLLESRALINLIIDTEDCGLCVSPG